MIFSAIKASKLESPMHYPSIYDAVCVTLSNTKCLRNAFVVSQHQRRKIAMWCAEAIAKHLRILSQLSPLSIPDNKMRQSVVGLLYLMRSGVVFHDTVVLPRNDLLLDVLPLESNLEGVFKIKGKCITEMENIVKGVFRSSSRLQLQKLGLYAVGSML
jgi:hypothetical protein